MKKSMFIVMFGFFPLVNLFSQQTPVEFKVITGNEAFTVDENETPPPNFEYENFPPLNFAGGFLTLTFHPTGKYTMYDVQSNGVPNQIWQDPLIPANVHAVVMYSNSASLNPRYCAYMFSNDMGLTWMDLGDIPAEFNSGFPSITGLPNGSAVIANHNNSNSTSTRTKIYVDLGAGIGAFSEYDPGNSPFGESLFPFVLGVKINKILFASSEYTNSLTLPQGNFSGFQNYQAGTSNGYWLARSNNGTVGHAYIGDGDDIHDLFYRVSTDEGLTWSSPNKIWNWNIAGDSLGVLNGISMVFLNNDPFITFNTMPLTETGFFPQRPSEIRVWSPSVNSGVPFIVADSSNVPFNPNTGIVSDGFTPICRPAIGKNDPNLLLVAFNAASDSMSSIDSSRYYSCWATYSHDGGHSWHYPERITPLQPVMDWRYISVSPNLLIHAGFPIYNFLVQVDPIPGSYVYGAPISYAQFIGIRGGFTISVNQISSELPESYNLYQNYPNPFNPSTKIEFDIPVSANVSLIVYDISGREIEKIIDSKNLSAGKYQAEFNANDLSSGVYFYKIRTGKYSQTRKMMLIR
jgi:hypothetical protein